MTDHAAHARLSFANVANYRSVRAEYLVALVVASVTFLWHITDVRWPVFVAMFVYIDVIGYLPGLVAYLRSDTGRISPVFHVLYNVMHSLITAGLVVGLWAWLVGPEWALLAVPIHLFGDRGLLGNYVKPASEPFEPYTTARQRAYRERSSLEPVAS